MHETKTIHNYDAAVTTLTHHNNELPLAEDAWRSILTPSLRKRRVLLVQEDAST
jgi:hypothetical protein